ncbi:NAD(P)-dependent oxidoreductase [Phyllobacterium zundukense]|uniref:3-beta hydroxysteroid dehydrogenase n=1 Tax=Phyllobacterium zundukense TaxID=1867719 RepID=A0A2N9VVR3_9HYPH|nr:NAD(P)-dependent oxidoreductase [Phyllobacterium zundukense]ATU91316.1 3-beta hydroxysteroid dehydrogenase [Phyllobacterium zundukense]PIO43581.1 3-beta hydroxysteroid dehydrogenase [Phyllobacterium zundukense]
MKIALIGATGFVGKELLKEAISRSHSVTALVRSPDKVEKLDDVTAVEADALNTTDLAAKLKGHDIVISAYNPGWGNPDIKAIHIAASKSITEAAKEAGVSRLIVIGGAGSLYNEAGGQFVDGEGFPAEYKEGALGARQALNDLRGETGLDWSFVSPPFALAPGERTGNYRVGKDHPVFDAEGKSAISVGDLAVAIVDEAEKPKHSRERFTVAY